MSGGGLVGAGIDGTCTCGGRISVGVGVGRAGGCCSFIEGGDTGEGATCSWGLRDVSRVVTSFTKLFPCSVRSLTCSVSCCTAGNKTEQVEHGTGGLGFRGGRGVEENWEWDSEEVEGMIGIIGVESVRGGNESWWGGTSEEELAVTRE